MAWAVPVAPHNPARADLAGRLESSVRLDAEQRVTGNKVDSGWTASAADDRSTSPVLRRPARSGDVSQRGRASL